MSNLDTTAAAYISQRIATNMNISDVTPQAKITLLTQGILTEKSIFEAYTEQSLRNMYLQTAEADYIEKAGVADGVVRTKEPMIRVQEQDAVVTLQRSSGDLQSTILPVGFNIPVQEGSYWIRLLKEVDLAQAENEIYLEGDIISYEENNSLTFLEGTSYPFTNGTTDYSITFQRSVSIPLLVESIEEYRNRVLYARQVSKTGSQSAIRLALSSIPLITNYTLDFNQDPVEVLIFNKSLIESDLDYESLTQYAIPLAESKLNLVASEGSFFNVNIPKKVDFSVKFKQTVKDARALPSSLYNLSAYIRDKYKLGAVFTFNVEVITEYLQSIGEDFDFINDYQMELYMNFIGNSYLVKTREISINQDEYPFLREVLVE